MLNYLKTSNSDCVLPYSPWLHFGHIEDSLWSSLGSGKRKLKSRKSTLTIQRNYNHPDKEQRKRKLNLLFQMKFVHHVYLFSLFIYLIPINNQKSIYIMSKSQNWRSKGLLARWFTLSNYPGQCLEMNLHFQTVNSNIA